MTPLTLKRHAGLLLGVVLSACGDKPPPEQPDAGVPAEERLQVQAARAVGPPGVPGDFDGDGHVDLLAGGYDGLTLGRGRGDGTFAEPESVTRGALVLPSAAGDLDKDGDLDLISAAEHSRRLIVLVNDGTARFVKGDELAVGAGRMSVALADVDGDGVLDVLATQDMANLLTVWRTAGTGSLSTRVDLATHPTPADVTAADLNGDGHPELIVANASGAPLEVIDVKGFTGAPVGRQEVAVGSCQPAALAQGDFDKDTDTDVALSCHGLVVLRNDGQAGLTLAQRLPSGGPTHRLTATDVNGDGRVDIVLDDYAQGPTLFSGVGDGTFVYRSGWAINVRRRAPSFSGGEWLRASGVYVLDVDEDGRLDLVAGTSSTRYHAFLPGDGRGGFIGPESKLVESRAQVHAFVDLSGDGVLDVFSQRMLFINGPDGTFQGVPSEYDGTNLITYAVDDVNGDGRGDVMSHSGGDGTLWLTTGQTVVKGSTFRYVSGPPSGVRDVDHDGTLDLQFGGSFARGLGGGSFADVLGFPTAFEFVLSLGASLADHTGDGEADAYTSNYSVRECYSSGRCETRPRGPALFVWSKGSKRYEYHSAPPLAALSVRDYTGDGIPDLLAEKVFARGVGNGSFASPEPLPPLSTMEKLRLGLTYHSLAADVDGDGLTDILKIRGEWLDVMRGQEDGELAPPVTVFAPSVAESLLSNYPDYHPTVRLVDIDDDGLPELVWQSVQGFAALRFTRR